MRPMDKIKPSEMAEMILKWLDEQQAIAVSGDLSDVFLQYEERSPENRHYYKWKIRDLRRIMQHVKD